MSCRITTLVLAIILSGACQSKTGETTAPDSSENYDSLAEGKEEEPVLQENEEHVMSFKQFHKKYIASGMLPLLKLPFLLPVEEAPPLETLDSPEGAFENIPNKNYEVRVHGLLPDTSRYYAIVYDFQMGDYTSNRETGIYSTRVATFSKDGKLIDRAAITTVGTFQGATSCGYFDNNIKGYIAANLSFFGIHILTQDCSNDGRIRPLQLTMNTRGAIQENGKIDSSAEEIQDQGDENKAEMTEKLKIIVSDISDVIRSLQMDTPLTPGDLTYFFPTADLEQSLPYTWYVMYYPTPGTPLTTVVRRIKSDESMRKRQYGFALVTKDAIGKSFSFFWEDGRTLQSNEPSVSVIADHFILITTNDAAGPTGKYVESTDRLLTISGNDLVSATSFSKGDLRIERNWIFAKHGMKFKSPELTEYYSRFDWYKPTRSEIPEGELLYEEKQVVAVIQALERQ